MHTVPNILSSHAGAFATGSVLPTKRAHLISCMLCCCCWCTHELNRLPKLDEIQLDLRNDMPLPSAMLLATLLTAVTGLQKLVIWMGSHQDWTAAPYCWEQLAEFTQLRTLSVQSRRVGVAWHGFGVVASMTGFALLHYHMCTVVQESRAVRVASKACPVRRTV